MIPLRLLSADRFAALRSFLEQSAFAEPELCKVRKISRICDLATLGEGREPETLDSALAILARLFLDREPAPINLVQNQLGKTGFRLMQEFGLVRLDPFDPQACLSTVMLYPTHGLYVASDRDWEPETGRDKLPCDDAVYLSITPNAYDFLAALPSSPCEDFLDVCSGTAVAGMIAARNYAKSAYAVDIAERCTQFAKWNAILNGVDNLIPLTGNAYEPVSGRTFSRIVAHPPYVPSAERDYVFRYAGVDGEQITRAILGGLPDALRPGGQCYVTAAIQERHGAPVETRVREMLGEAESEFDVFVAVRRQIATKDFLGKPTPGQGLLDGESFAYCSIAIQRWHSQRPTFTIRKPLPMVIGPNIEWFMRWEAMQRETGFPERLLRERLFPAPGVKLRVTHSLTAGKWTPSESQVITNRPFPVEADCPAWVSAMIEICDRRPTVREALETLKARQAVASQASGAEFARLVQMLVSAGVLEIASLPLPLS